MSHAGGRQCLPCRTRGERGGGAPVVPGELSLHVPAQGILQVAPRQILCDQNKRATPEEDSKELQQTGDSQRLGPKT